MRQVVAVVCCVSPCRWHRVRNCDAPPPLTLFKDKHAPIRSGSVPVSITRNNTAKPRWLA